MMAGNLFGRLRRMEAATYARRARLSAVPYGEPDDGVPAPPMSEAEWLGRYGCPGDVISASPPTKKEPRQ